MSLIIRRLIWLVVLKSILNEQVKSRFTILLLLNCTTSFHAERNHIECVKAE
jgi:hypothetical protein